MRNAHLYRDPEYFCDDCIQSWRLMYLEREGEVCSEKVSICLLSHAKIKISASHTTIDGSGSFSSTPTSYPHVPTQHFVAEKCWHTNV